MDNSGIYTYDNPEAERNWHHTFRYGYEYHGRIDKKDDIFKDSGTSTYPRSFNDNLSSYLYKYGHEIKL